MLQSKCGIRPAEGTFDFSKEHILASIPAEIAEAFGRLQHEGKVRTFGVSNQNPTLIELIQRALPMKLLFNQLQLSVAFAPMIASSLHRNNKDDEGRERCGTWPSPWAGS